MFLYSAVLPDYDMSILHLQEGGSSAAERGNHAARSKILCVYYCLCLGLNHIRLGFNYRLIIGHLYGIAHYNNVKEDPFSNFS